VLKNTTASERNLEVRNTGNDNGISTAFVLTTVDFNVFSLSTAADVKVELI
jgi:hypothetical protein